MGTGELAQWLRICTDLAEDQVPFPTSCWAAHNCLQLQLQGIQYPFLDSIGPAVSYMPIPCTDTEAHNQS